MLKEALFYERDGALIRCNLCPHNCPIKDGACGICRVRTNQDGELYSINYGEVTALSLDPIEKKPLYRFHPRKDILSVGSFGCNFSCDFCQNYRIAQKKPDSKYIEPMELVRLSSIYPTNIGLAFTYNEPTIWYEYIYDTIKLLKKESPQSKAILITNGFINPEPLEKLLPYIDAMNIDLKAFNDDYYKRICGGKLEPVLKAIELASKHCHIEVTTLLVTDLNDSAKEVENISKFLSDIRKDIPLHLSRYFPSHKMTKPATDIEVMIRSKEIAKKYLDYVYLGNV